MRSVDVHQHLWPERLVAALARRTRPPCLRDGRLELAEGSFPFHPRDHELEARLALLDRDGVDVAVLSLPPTLECDPHPELREAYHEGALELVAASGGRLLALAAGEAREGFAGATVSAAALAAGLGELPAELERTGGVLFVHPGPPAAPPAGAPPWWSAVVDYTAQMQAAYAVWLARQADEHPGLPVVFAVLAGGAPVQLERMGSRGVEERALVRPTVYLECASYGRRALELCLAAHGPGQILYGSDRPVVDPRPTLRALTELDEPLERAVRRENPGRLFP